MRRASLEVRKGYDVLMDAIANAELAMRVKALEANVAELQKRERGLALVLRLTKDVEELRAQR